MRIKSEGNCNFCKDTFSNISIGRHLQSCEKRIKAHNSEKKSGKRYLLKAGAGPFWVYFEVDTQNTLEKVDDFLRNLWLDCCGHLSAFKIDEQTYSYDQQEEFGDKSMRFPLHKVISPGQTFSHEYDFGTTTYLTLKCISEREGETKKINILARNNLPHFPCHTCKKTPARDICSQCLWESKSMFCAHCAKKHKCDEEMFLPVVNSPRMGMCGYTGE